MSDDYDDDDAVESTAADDVELTSFASESGAEGADITARNRMREQLDADVEAFLARGGKIQSVDANVMADPPKRPESNYGGQPI
jgi:hypothetical protein